MRKFLISLMAASALMPAVAQAEDGAILRAMRSHAERSNQNDNKSDNSSSASQSSHRAAQSNDDRPTRTDRTSRPNRQSGVERVERADGGDHNTRRTGRIERAWRAQRDQQQVEATQSPTRVQDTDRTERRHDGLAGAFSRAGRDMADGRTGDRDEGGDWRRDRDGRRDGDRDWQRDGRRDGDRDWRRDGDNHHRWSRDWRRNSRYDWFGYRNHYRSLFRLGRYYDPYGWGYRRFSIGFSLWPSYYGSSFWLDDPWHYRLPPAYGPYRWIRYYDDALLVNIYTGEVVDVVYNVFW